jgi:hypothetical protein
MTETTAASTGVPVSIQLIGGATVLLEIGGLRLLTDPAFDAPRMVPSGDRTLTKTTGPRPARVWSIGRSSISARWTRWLTKLACSWASRSPTTPARSVVRISPGAASSVQPGHRPRISPARHATLLRNRDFRVGRQANPERG